MVAVKEHTNYCSKEHQAQDWKKHSKACFAPGAQSARCLQNIPFPPDECIVEHAEHLLEDHGSSFGPDGACLSFGCLACKKSFEMTSSAAFGARRQDLKVTSGAKYCYQGRHTVKPLKEGDQRRSYDDVLVLTLAGPALQSKIDSLDGDSKALRSSGISH